MAEECPGFKASHELDRNPTKGSKSKWRQRMKVKFDSLPYIYPIPIVLIGVNVNGKPNFTTIGDVGLMGINPPLVYISSHIKHHSNKGILETGCYSINFPSTDMLSVVDYCGQVSGKDVDKGALFDIFYGDLETVPLIQKFPVNLECRVVKEFCIQHRQVFVSEVVQTHVDEAFVSKTDDRLVIAALPKLDPVLYGLDNRYYQIGAVIGTGYQEAEKLGRDCV
jgi:flavin reductase (DIM6/NTAB) family NADH-FMN oxidoreductase RutF